MIPCFRSFAGGVLEVERVSVRTPNSACTLYTDRTAYTLEVRSVLE